MGTTNSASAGSRVRALAESAMIGLASFAGKVFRGGTRAAKTAAGRGRHAVETLVQPDDVPRIAPAAPRVNGSEIRGPSARAIARREARAQRAAERLARAWQRREIPRHQDGQDRILDGARQVQRNFLRAVAVAEDAERELRAANPWLAARVRTAEHNADRGVSSQYLWQSGDGTHRIRAVVPAAGVENKGMSRAVPTAKPSRPLVKGGGRSAARQPKGRARRRARRAARARERANASARASLNHGMAHLKGHAVVPTAVTPVTKGLESESAQGGRVLGKGAQGRDWDPPETGIERPRANPWLGRVTVPAPAAAPPAPGRSPASPERDSQRTPRTPTTSTIPTPPVLRGMSAVTAFATPPSAPSAAAGRAEAAQTATGPGAVPSNDRRPGLGRVLRGPGGGVVR